MISKKEMYYRLWDMETQIDYLYDKVNQLEKKIKKLTPKEDKKGSK